MTPQKLILILQLVSCALICALIVTLTVMIKLLRRYQRLSKLRFDALEEWTGMHRKDEE